MLLYVLSNFIYLKLSLRLVPVVYPIQHFTCFDRPGPKLFRAETTVIITTESSETVHIEAESAEPVSMDMVTVETPKAEQENEETEEQPETGKEEKDVEEKEADETAEETATVTPRIDESNTETYLFLSSTIFLARVKHASEALTFFYPTRSHGYFSCSLL